MSPNTLEALADTASLAQPVDKVVDDHHGVTTAANVVATATTTTHNHTPKNHHAKADTTTTLRAATHATTVHHNSQETKNLSHRTPEQPLAGSDGHQTTHTNHGTEDVTSVPTAPPIATATTTTTNTTTTAATTTNNNNNNKKRKRGRPKKHNSVSPPPRPWLDRHARPASRDTPTDHAVREATRTLVLAQTRATAAANALVEAQRDDAQARAAALTAQATVTRTVQAQAEERLWTDYYHDDDDDNNDNDNHKSPCPRTPDQFRDRDDLWMWYYHCLVKFKERYGHTNLKKSDTTDYFVELGMTTAPSTTRHDGSVDDNDNNDNRGTSTTATAPSTAATTTGVSTTTTKQNKVIKPRLLAQWIRVQRRVYRDFYKPTNHSTTPATTSLLPLYQRVLLDRLDFDWAPIQGPNTNLWRAKYDQLKAFHAQHGHCRVPSKHPLAVWRQQMASRYRNTVQLHHQQQQQQQHKDGGTDHENDTAENSATANANHNEATSTTKKAIGRTLNPQQMELLDALHLEWQEDHLTVAWEDRFAELMDFYNRHGHPNVPWRWKENLGLAGWVNYQRNKYRELQEGKPSAVLTAEQIERLTALGFHWRSRQGKYHRRSLARQDGERGHDDDDGGDGHAESDDENENAYAQYVMPTPVVYR